MDVLGQSSLLVALISFALGFSVLARNVRNILFLSFATLCALISMWALSFFLDKVWPDLGFYRFHLFFNLLLAPACLSFIRVMVRMQDRWSRRLLQLSSIISVALSLAILLNMDSLSWVRQLIYFSPALVLFQTFHLMWIDSRAKSGKGLYPHPGVQSGGRRVSNQTPHVSPGRFLSSRLALFRFSKFPAIGVERRNLIYLGAIFVLATSVMDHVPWMGLTVPAVGNVALVIYLFFLSQAISQQRLLNMSALFSRFLVLLSVALTLTIVYSLLVAWIENSPGLFFLNSFIASFLILMLLEPLRSLVGYFTQRLLTQKNRRLQQALREAQRKLTGIVDLGHLFQAILATSEQILEPRWGALFVLRADGTKYRRVRVSENPLELTETVHPVLREILADHSLIQYSSELAEKGKFPILLDQILENEIDRSASRIQRAHYALLIEGLKALGSNLLIPLYTAGKTLGFVVLNVPSPPEPWGNNWGLLPVIYPYFEQAAHTMQNMEIYSRQREKERLAALGEMAAGLAHEIRNPLGAIKGAAQFLDPSLNRPESRFLKVIIEEVDRLNRVVTQFLDYSKPPVVNLACIDLSKLVEKTLELMNPSLRAGIQLEFYPSRVPAKIMASAEQIRQVLINLIQNAQNALEGREKGLIRVDVVVEGTSYSGDAVLSVEDTGRGIKREHLEKLFIPFFTTSPQGTGLGLSISQKIVEAHRGRIEVLSEEDQFTRFSVILPLASQKE